jgi:nucleotide-binding universal stress UspA family protein
MIKSILVGLGGAPFSDVAIRRAVELAARHGASITGVTIVNPGRLGRVGPVPLGGGAYAEKMRERRLAVSRESLEQALASLETTCGQSGIHCRIVRETKDPFEAMISHARYSDLIVFGLRSLFDCDFDSACGLSSEPRESVIRLIASEVRPMVAVSPQYREIRSALIAYSGSMGSAKAMRRFVQLRPWTDLRVGIVHFEEHPGQGAVLVEEAADYCRGHGLTVETAVVSGEARAGLLNYAREKDYDLLVLGNGMRSLLMRRLLGDTVLDLIQKADRPLFMTQ